MLLRKLLKRTSHLGRDERVVFFPSMGWRIEGTGIWKVEFHGWVFRDKYNPLATRPLFEMLGFKEEWKTMEHLLFEERLHPFLVDNKRRKQLTVRLGELVVQLRRTAPNGHVRHSIELPDDDMQAIRERAPAPDLIRYTLNDRTDQGDIRLLAPTGLSVISDLDDTLKETGVHDRHLLITNTFFKPFIPVEGMAGLFQQWAYSHHAVFHYVSASPWQLFGSLEEFLKKHQFPSGTFHLKPFRWKDRTRRNLFQSPQRYKRSTIQPILERFPRRKFILVGDSGEKDPEVYAELAGIHPNVHRIFIRELSGDIQRERYRTIFQGLPRTLWQVFQHPSEIDFKAPI